MSRILDPEEIINEYEKNGDIYARARGESLELEHTRKALLSTLMMNAKDAGAKSNVEQEKVARSSYQYIQLLEALNVVKTRETLAYIKMEASKMRYQLWITERADLRNGLKV